MAHKDKYTRKQLENLGNRLREIRISKGYSNYEYFAFEHNLPRAQYGRYEQGKDLRLSSLIRTLKAMDISLAEFFGTGFDEEAIESANK